tara:strand:+ start:205 stop:330 length:126 start_codon:yes stop_codon:yes gene_type:complete
MEYMGIWEAQHLGVIDSIEYVLSWIVLITFFSIMLYIAKKS